MPKVICTLPCASELISGVKFVKHKLGVISEEIEQDVADAFLQITGYVLAGKKQDSASAPAASDAPKAPDTAADQTAGN